jgi:glycosyltransferase involved in cell wall biosynthesis
MDEIARHLARSHHVIAYRARGEDQQKVEQYDGVEYRLMSAVVDCWFFITPPGNYAAARSGVSYLQPTVAVPAVQREVVADPVLWTCDIVDIMNVSQFVPFVRARTPKTRIVLQMHSQSLEKLDAAVIEPRIGARDLVLGVSDFIAAGLRRRFPALAQRCSHIYSRVDPVQLARPAGFRPKPKQLLYVGRLAPEKGIHILLDALRIVLSHHPDAHLQLIGPHVRPRDDGVATMRRQGSGQSEGSIAAKQAILGFCSPGVRNGRR